MYPSFKYVKYFHNMTFVSVIFCYIIITLMLKDNTHNYIINCEYVCEYVYIHTHIHMYVYLCVYQHISHK